MDRLGCSRSSSQNQTYLALHWDDYRCATASPDAVEWNSPQRMRVLRKLSVVDAGGGPIAKSASAACQAFDHIASQF